MMDKTWSTSAKQQMLSPIRIFTQEQRVCVRRNIIRRSILQEWVVAWTIGIRKRHGWNTASCGESQNIAIFLRQNLHKYIKVISVTGDRGGMCSSSEVYYSLVKKPRSTSVARRCITKSYLIVEEHNTKTLKIIPYSEYLLNADNVFLYEVISDADTEDEADLLRNHINEVGGIQEYFNEIGRNHCMYGWYRFWGYSGIRY